MLKMKTILISSLLISSSAIVNAESSLSGKQLYKQNCASCHGNKHGMDMSKRSAPPIIAVKKHYLPTYSDRDSFILAISEWIKQPEKENSLMRGAIKKFGVMPKLDIKQSDAEKIAAFLFDNKIKGPAAYQKHFEQMHGKKK